MTNTQINIRQTALSTSALIISPAFTVKFIDA